MNTLDFGVDHPVVDGIAKSITLLSSGPVPGMTTAEVAKYAADLADTFAKQISIQRGIMISRLQIMHAYQQSVQSGQAVKLDDETAAFCAALGYEDWPERGMSELLSSSREQLKPARYEWYRAEIYRMVTQAQLMIELTSSDYALALPQKTQDAQ